MALLIACFIIALIIYFGVYYEKDKKTMEEWRRTRIKRSDEEYLIFPFFEENRRGPQDDIPDHSGDPNDCHEDYFDQ